MRRLCKDAVLVGLTLCLVFVCMGCNSSGVWKSEADQSNAQPIEGDAHASQAGQLVNNLNDSSGNAPGMETLAAVQAFIKKTEDYAPEPKFNATSNDAIRGVIEGNQNRQVVSHTPPFVRQTVPSEHPAKPRIKAKANMQMNLESEPAMIAPQALPIVRKVSIRVDQSAGLTLPVQTPKSSATNAPISVGENAIDVTLEDFVARLQKEAGETSELDPHWRLMLLRLALGYDEEAAKLSSSLSPDARNLLQAYAKAGSVIRAAARNPYRIADGSLVEVKVLQDTLANLSDPVVANIALCRRVNTFGDYERMDPSYFVAGRNLPTIIYCEIENFRSERTEEGKYRTVLATTVELYTKDGQRMWNREEPEVKDLCHRRRHDFFLAQRVTLPATLPAGEYILKIYVEDKLSGLANEGQYSLTIHAPARTSVIP